MPKVLNVIVTFTNPMMPNEHPCYVIDCGQARKHVGQGEYQLIASDDSILPYIQASAQTCDDIDYSGVTYKYGRVLADTNGQPSSGPEDLVEMLDELMKSSDINLAAELVRLKRSFKKTGEDKCDCPGCERRRAREVEEKAAVDIAAEKAAVDDYTKH